MEFKLPQITYNLAQTMPECRASSARCTCLSADVWLHQSKWTVATKGSSTPSDDAFSALCHSLIQFYTYSLGTYSPITTLSIFRDMHRSLAKISENTHSTATNELGSKMDSAKNSDARKWLQETIDRIRTQIYNIHMETNKRKTQLIGW